MNLSGKRSRVGAAVIGAALAATLGLGASPASAKASDGWVRGYDKHIDDFDDEGTLGSFLGGHSPSNAVCMWQRILWAEGATASTGRPFPEAFINGYFGEDTQTATKWLQERWHLDVDGRVGNQTFGKAHIHNFQTGGSTDRGETLYLEYRGRSHSFPMRRNTEGKYLFKDSDGDWRQAGYDYLSCD
ncbi:Putative peptidoglycan binding domain-containing protein [Streptomyces sp. cf386]|uniref:peptidoglycan-binding domain-containing protein n=1 Tax=Streptomyces sp. cf386 TaxID=1761904 RepID=UPI00088867D9|nr:peptidoglycan-binding domain-containing protein [Streptomyces sp. cf386]SDN01630.1 Putative peptidoglycan binding domain-containing protein [Streptomyces sp. cf386]